MRGAVAVLSRGTALAIAVVMRLHLELLWQIIRMQEAAAQELAVEAATQPPLKLEDQELVHHMQAAAVVLKQETMQTQETRLA